MAGLLRVCRPVERAETRSAYGGWLMRVLPAPGRAAMTDLFLALVNALLRLPGHRFRMCVLRRVCAWSVGAGSVVERGLRVTARGGVTIGTGCVVNRGVLLDGRGDLTIGDHVNISGEAVVLTADHDPASPTFQWRARPVSIGSRSWIATRAIVLPGSVVGEGAVVGAGATVAGVVPRFAIVTGAGAVPIALRAPDAQQSLPRYRRWWH